MILTALLFAVALVSAIIRPTPVTIALTALLVIPLAFLLYFFRDPKRTPPQREDVIIAPADGEVVDITSVEEPHFISGQALKISIFMSVFSVHVNRAPVTGTVELVRHVPGQFLQAFRPESSDVNEHNLIGMNSAHGRVLVKQIAGILARRIVCWVESDQQVELGQRLGLIKLGSRVDTFLPPGATPQVAVGDQTKAGKTILASWPTETEHR